MPILDLIPISFNFNAAYAYSNIISGCTFIAIFFKLGSYSKNRIRPFLDKQRKKIGIIFLVFGISYIVLAITDLFFTSYRGEVMINILMAGFVLVAYISLLRFWKNTSTISIPSDIEAEINARFQIEGKLINKNKQLEWAERTAKICYANWDVNKNEILFSGGVEELLAINPHEPLNYARLKSIIIAEDRIKMQRFLESIADTQGITSLLFRVIMDSKLKYIQMNAEIHNDEKHAHFIRGTFQDVTEQQMFIKRIEDKNELLKQIAWTQSHEVRGPLASILGLISLIDEEDFQNEQNKFIISGFKESAHELDHIIRKIVKKAESAEVDLG